MATEQAAVASPAATDSVVVNTYTNGLLRPDAEMLGPVKSGGRIIATTAPGCWGPMITPAIRGGHEVTEPVSVDGAEVGDAIAIKIGEITIHSIATASGNDQWVEGRFLGDPYVAARCASCGLMYPETEVVGTGQGSVRCKACGAEATPFTFTSGYTMVFDDERSLGVTVGEDAAEKIGGDPWTFGRIPENSRQNPILAFAPHDLPGMVARVRPFLGQLGTTPGVTIPDSHNAGDFGSFLIGAPHEYALTPNQLLQRTDGHMDIDAVRPGAVVVCPVKVSGGGVYVGDMHALQGDGEIAGHTCDVAGAVTLEVDRIPALELDGPVIFPLAMDLPYLARPLSADEAERAGKLARQWGIAAVEETLPISVVGTGPDLNSATDNGLERASQLLGMSVPEVRNRATVTGAIEIGRHPGVVQVTFLAPRAALDQAGLLEIADSQYGAA